mmetsp:Transcript_37608/g.61826  ORF Transcript_37608/g.61826 Transcript_37608/m.61826 type:complete len:491 (-) Transcript_37608:91-1563(-)
MQFTMARFLLFAIASSLQVISTWSQVCPSDAYVYCATEGGACTISDTINEGYMSYGANGRWTLVPFTNDHTDGTDIRIECDNDHGDIIPGTGKYCCYIAADTGFVQENYYGALSENDGGWDFSCCNAYTFGMRYGTGSRFTYRVINGATGWCNNEFFNDPARGTGKVCNYYFFAPPSVPEPYSTKWTICGNEGSDCTGLADSAAQWVRYGDNGQYYLRLVISASDGRIPCSNNFFDDPRPGYGKYCWRADPQYTFDGVVGQWTKLQSCLGCAESQYRKLVGVTDVEENEITDTWEWSLTTTVSAGFEFKAVSASTEVSSTIGNSVANRMLTSISKTVEEESTFTCGKDVLYQWTLGAEQNNGISTKSFTVKGEDLACLDNPLEPKCPPGFCTDDDCQTCTQSLQSLPSVFDPNDVGLPQVPVFPNSWFGNNVYLPTAYSNLLILSALLVIVLLTANICVMAWSKCRKAKKSDYDAVKVMDTDCESEAPML